MRLASIIKTQINKACGLFFSLCILLATLAIPTPFLSASDGEIPDVHVQAAERIRPSVVSIAVVTKSQEISPPEWWLLYWLGAERAEFWRTVWFKHIRKTSTPLPHYVPRAGTGLVIGQDGLILTNEHLISDAQDIFVTLFSGTRFKASVVAVDPWLDLAILRIAAKKLPVPVFADSNKIEVGQEILSVGNALGFSHTVSRGIISGTKRFVRDDQGRFFENVFQTDAAVNFGDSGGPLINTQGEVIALKLAIVPQGENISFALPTNEFRRVLPELLTSGEIKRGWIGVYVSERKITNGNALIVEKLYVNSPSQIAGIKNGDRIVEVNGFEPPDAHAFYRFIRDRSIGEHLNLRILRNNELFVKAVSVAAFPRFVPSSATSQKDPLDFVTEQFIPPDLRWLVLLVTLFCMWLSLRLIRIRWARWKSSINRRYGSRRKGERRKGDRRKTRPDQNIFPPHLERRKGERRKAERRSGFDRRDLQKIK